MKRAERLFHSPGLMALGCCFLISAAQAQDAKAIVRKADEKA